jgi:hypothetical protein
VSELSGRSEASPPQQNTGTGESDTPIFAHYTQHFARFLMVLDRSSCFFVAPLFVFLSFDWFDFMTQLPTGKQPRELP